VLWLALVAAVVLFAPATDGGHMLCNFKRVTGVPCPTCGTTRAVIALTSGDVTQAFVLNPLTTLALFMGFFWMILRIGFGASMHCSFAIRGARISAWGALAALVLANWVYLIVVGR